jgi:hypothetical protein
MDPRYSLNKRLDRPQLVWTQRVKEKSFASVMDRTLVIQFVVIHYTD